MLYGKKKLETSQIPLLSLKLNKLHFPPVLPKIPAFKISTSIFKKISLFKKEKMLFRSFDGGNSLQRVRAEKI